MPVMPTPKPCSPSSVVKSIGSTFPSEVDIRQKVTPAESMPRQSNSSRAGSRAGSVDVTLPMIPQKSEHYVGLVIDCPYCGALPSLPRRDWKHWK
jgi:hypothetical protein